MRRPLVLAGGPAVGKTTCGRALAEERPRAAYIDVDVRQLVVAGHEAPWAGPGGRDQHALGARNASALATNFLQAEFDVTIADMLSTTTSRIYPDALPNCLIVHLKISLAGAHQQAATRRVYLTTDKFEALHRADAQSPPAADVVLQVDPWRAYVESKACDVALALAWDRRLPDVTSAAVDPGWVKTKLASPGAPGDVSSSADTIAFCCTSADLASAPYWKNRAPTPVPGRLRDPALQDAILAACDRMVGVG
jgi:hypothetical protein